MTVLVIFIDVAEVLNKFMLYCLVFLEIPENLTVIFDIQGFSFVCIFKRIIIIKSMRIFEPSRNGNF